MTYVHKDFGLFPLMEFGVTKVNFTLFLLWEGENSRDDEFNKENPSLVFLSGCLYKLQGGFLKAVSYKILLLPLASTS